MCLVWGYDVMGWIILVFLNGMILFFLRNIMG